MSTDPSSTREGEPLFELIRQRYGHRLTASELEEVHKGVQGVARMTATLRTVRLENADEPFSVFIPYRGKGKTS